MYRVFRSAALPLTGKHMQSHTSSSRRAIDDRRGRFALQGLDEEEQYRFRTSLRAVAGRSLYHWDEVPQHQADVLVMGSVHTSVARSTAPITLWLADEPVGPPSDDVFHLPASFNTPTLWGVLDLIALRLMDTRKQPAAGDPAPVPNIVDADDKPTYRLLRWVMLDPTLQEARFRMTMAFMTTRGVSLDTLTAHGGLEREEARLLLRALHQHGVLEISMRNQRIWPAPQISAHGLRHPVFRRFGEWLRSSGR